MSSANRLRVVIVPGNGGGNVRKANWYGWLEKQLKQADVEVRLENMPDPVVARESVWIPFMEKELGCDENTVIVGHSSGAEAAMRFAEQCRLHAIVLVSACHTDLGMPSEAASGYYSRPWLWDQIKTNVKDIVQFGSTDDPFIPWDEQEHVHQSLDTRLEKFSDKGHFMNSEFPALLDLVMSLVKEATAGKL